MQFSSPKLLMIVAILVSLPFGLTGCSNSDRLETVAVYGKVTYKGEPLPSGSVIFVPVSGGPTAEANIESDGKYSLGTYEKTDGVPPGEYDVMVVAMSEQQSMEAADAAAGSESLIPSRYGDPSKSGLKASVKPDDDNEINFDLVETAPTK